MSEVKIYLVGGAVRDELLGLPIKERDWVVVGATPEYMLAHKYRPVGKDFPVFLHPKSQEEYALARTERKQGRGYKGFVVYAAEDVTLEQDLQRRDLTINAIAKDESGKLVDPYHGQQDIENRILRHVSPAFVEDPLRVLRLARFAARFADLGFAVAPETRTLLIEMVNGGELNDLVSERVWREIDKAFKTDSPAVFIEILRDIDALKILLPEIDELFASKQDGKNTAGDHALSSLTHAARLSDSPQVRMAAFVQGVKEIDKLCRRLAIPNDFRDLAVLVQRFCQQAHQLSSLNAEALVKLLQNLDLFRRPERLMPFLLACEADYLADDKNAKPYLAKEKLPRYLEAANQVDVKKLVDEGLSGKALGDAIYQARIKALHLPKTRT